MLLYHITCVDLCALCKPVVQLYWTVCVVALTSAKFGHIVITSAYLDRHDISGY